MKVMPSSESWREHKRHISEDSTCMEHPELNPISQA